MFKKKQILMPTHIAFIMDGNRRWATRRGLNKMVGHRQGATAMYELIKLLAKMDGIKIASFFAFSTENWNREQSEIDYLFELVQNLLKEKRDEFDDLNVKVVQMGDISRFPKDFQEAITSTVEKTKNNTGLVVQLALNYGGRDDIVCAAKKVFESGQEITEESLKQNLYSPHDIDLLIRTSGEMRVSNFMLYQMAYSELYFTKTCWPDFDKKELQKALTAFSKRNRRFGGK